MVAPSWHVVPFTRRLLETLPAEQCCNCGCSDDVTMRSATLRYAEMSAFETLYLRLPTCAACAPTLRTRPPTASSLMVKGLGLTTVGAALGTALQVEPPYVLAITAVGALSAVGWARWLRRPPTGARATNFQPVRYLGRDPAVLETFYLSFANPEYAARVSAHAGELGPAPQTTRTGTPTGAT